MTTCNPFLFKIKLGFQKTAGALLTFVPLIIQCFPSSLFLAVVRKLATSEPAKASVMASALNFLPASISGTHSALSFSELGFESVSQLRVICSMTLITQS